MHLGSKKAHRPKLTDLVGSDYLQDLDIPGIQEQIGINSEDVKWI
jgi:hypothetical protein